MTKENAPNFITDLDCKNKLYLVTHAFDKLIDILTTLQWLLDSIPTIRICVCVWEGVGVGGRGDCKCHWAISVISTYFLVIKEMVTIDIITVDFILWLHDIGLITSGILKLLSVIDVCVCVCLVFVFRTRILSYKYELKV